MCGYISFKSIMGDCDVVKKANEFFEAHPTYRIITTDIIATDMSRQIIIGYEKPDEVTE